MGRKYSINFVAVAVTAQQDLLAFINAAGKVACVHSCIIEQSSDAGDAQDEMLDIRFKRGATVAGSGGGTMTPVPLDPGDAAFGGTARINDTTIANTGTIVTLPGRAMNVRAGLYHLPIPEGRIWVSGGQRLVVGLNTTPADSLTMSGELLIEEFG